jgi:hypothetical protein
MPSTVISRFVHDPDTGDLIVEFTTGRVYVYAHMPTDEVAAFRAAFSKGSYFNHHIRDHYSFREIAVGR